MPRRVVVSIGMGPIIPVMPPGSYIVQLSAAAATAAVVRACRPRVAGLVRRDGRGPKLGDQIVVLGGLRGSQTQLLIGALEILQLALGQEIEDRAAVAVGVVDDVPRCGLDGVAGVAALRSHVIPELCRVGPLVAAALSGLHLHGSQLLHESRLLVAAGKLGLCKAVCHRHVGAVNKLRLLVKSVAKALIYAVDLALNIGKVRGQHIAVDHAAAIAAVVAPAVAAPAAKNKQKQDNDPPCTVTAPAKAVSAAGGVGGSHRHGHRRHTVR